MMKFGIPMKWSGFFLAAFLLAAMLLIPGCVPASGPAAPAGTTATAVSAATVAPTNPPDIPTKPPAPTQEASPTTAIQAGASPTAAQPAVETQPAASPTAAANMPAPAAGETGLSAWCLPLDASVSNAKDPLSPPANARKAKTTSAGLEVRGLPANGCVFLYTFSGKAPGGLKLEISELNQPKPFLTTELQPVEGKPEVTWAFVRHAVITSPPAERVSLTFVVRDPLGQVLQRDAVRLVSWMPGTPEPKEDDEDCGCGPILP